MSATSGEEKPGPLLLDPSQGHVAESLEQQKAEKNGKVCLGIRQTLCGSPNYAPVVEKGGSILRA
jgi:hypothetical protein